MPRKLSDISGRCFNRLRVVGYVGLNKHKQHTWACKCICGNSTVLTTSRITSKVSATKSCGCLHLETLEENQNKSRKHGYTKTHKNLYQIYYGVLARCYNPQHKDLKYYGAKGVTVSGWRNVEDFVLWGINTGYLVGLTIDRIDVSGNYSKENCEWVTRSENTKRKYA